MTDTLRASSPSVGEREYLPPPPAPVSFESFLAWLDEDVRAEWVDGEVVEMAPASLEHQSLLDFLNDLVKSAVRPRGLGTVLFAPFLMRLPSRPSGREPDLIFVAREHADRLRDTYLDGPADLVVEITSPESDARDRGEKFLEYEAAGIPEYWLVDPLRQAVWFYQRGDDGRYQAVPLDGTGVYHSAVIPGLRVRPAWLWRRPLSSADDVRRELGD